MTDFKRFKLVNPTSSFLSMNCGIKYGDRLLNFKEVVTLLNSLNDENKQLKEQIKIFEKFLEGNDLDIEWDLFCTAHVCDEEEIDCKDCKYMRWTDD